MLKLPYAVIQNTLRGGVGGVTPPPPAPGFTITDTEPTPNKITDTESPANIITDTQ